MVKTGDRVRVADNKNTRTMHEMMPEFYPEPGSLGTVVCQQFGRRGGPERLRRPAEQGACKARQPAGRFGKAHRPCRI